MHIIGGSNIGKIVVKKQGWHSNYSLAHNQKKILCFNRKPPMHTVLHAGNQAKCVRKSQHADARPGPAAAEHLLLQAFPLQLGAGWFGG